MSFPLIPVAESIFLVVALSLDALIASFAYGAKRIKIPFLSALLITLICSAILAVTLLAGTALRPFLSPGVTKGTCFIILLLLGTVKLFDSLLKTYIKNTKLDHGYIKFKLLDFKFILAVYAEPEKADADASNILTPKEAAVLAFALSLDGAAVGFGAGVADFNILLMIIFSLVLNLIAVPAGCRLGIRISEKSPVDFSWLSGAMLIIMAFTKLF